VSRIIAEDNYPNSDVLGYRDNSGSTPVLEWLRELRRPLADLLRDGIYELRIRIGRVHCRILYFFHGGTWRLRPMHSLRKTGFRQWTLIVPFA